MIAKNAITTLNITWMNAVCLALSLPPHAARIASIVEPISLPMTKAAEKFQVVSLLYASVITMAVVADDEWSRAVIIVPMNTPSRRLAKPQSSSAFIKLRWPLSTENAPESIERPRKSIEKPIKASPKFSLRIFFTVENRNPRPKIGTANEDMSKLKPNSATIHAVIVVPMFAPNITPTDCTSVSSPAFTKLTTITVVAPDDWIIIVRTIPVSNATKRLLVMRERAFFSPLPALFCMPSLISFIP